MRKDMLFGAVLALSPAYVMAQQCEAPAVCAPQCAPQCNQPQFKNAPGETQPKGNFLRGPATGQRAGESRSMGIRGPALHFPEVRIALPTLELPSPVKFVRDAEMLYDQGRGAFSKAEVHNFGNLGEGDDDFKKGSGDVNPPGPAPCSTPQYYYPPACAVPCADATTAKFEATLARMEMLEREIVALRQAAAQHQTTQQVQPVSSFHDSGAGKPSSLPPTVKSSRPVATSQFVQAGYQEPAVSAPRIATAPAPKSSSVRGTHKGLSAPPSTSTNQETSEFGTWSRSGQR